MSRHEDNVADLRNRHSNTAALTHEICSKLNSNLEAQASVTAGLEKSFDPHQSKVADLNHRQSSTAALTH